MAGSTTTTKPHRLTRAQQLARALARCRRIRNKAQRKSCIAAAQRRYGPRKLTRAQKLTRALAACHRIAGKRKRVRCIAAARRRYGPARTRRARAKRGGRRH